MKLLFVGSKASLDLNKIGGIESTMRELILFLKKKNYSIKVLLIDSKIKEEKTLKTEFGDVPITISNLSEIRKQLFNNYDVINFLQTPFTNPIFALYFWVYKLFSKSITTKFFFTYPTLKNSTFLQNLKLRFLIDKTYVFSIRLENLAKNLVENVTLLYPPVSNHFFNQPPREYSEKKKILFVGRLSMDKGLEKVIETFKNLPREKYFLGIMGYFANQKDKVFFEKKLHELNLDFLEIIIPATDNKSRLPLNEYDMLLLPYQDLGPTLDTPLLILEGLVSGCKIITSNIEPLNYIKGNIYFVDDFFNSKAFTDTVINVSAYENVKIIDDYSSKNFGEMYLKSLREMGVDV